MKALTFGGVGTIRHESVTDPSPLCPTDAIVQVERTAICGSDLHVYHGREQGLDTGTVMGHEFVGRIAEAGADGPETGRRVLSPFTTSCGTCFFCLEGLTARCESGQLFGWVAQGRGLHGAQAEFVRAPHAASTLVSLPDGVSAEEGLLLGDVLSTGYYCALRAEVRPGGVYAVVGCGPVGLMAIVATRELGGEQIFALDSVPERLALARSFGAETIHYQEQDAVEIVRATSNGRGADAVLEVVGSPAAHRLAADLVRPGGTISVVGVHNEDEFSFRPVEAYDKNLTYRVGRCPARSVLEDLIPMVQRKKYDLSSVFSHRLPLDQGPRGYDLFARKQDGCTKVVLTP